MPGIQDHCQYTLQRYGIEAGDIHSWMDAPVRIYGPKHRNYRHYADQPIPKEFVDKYTQDLCKNIIIDHILLDQEPYLHHKQSRPRILNHVVITKNGGSLKITIPSHIYSSLGWRPRDLLAVGFEESNIFTFEKFIKDKKYPIWTPKVVLGFGGSCLRVTLPKRIVDVVKINKGDVMELDVKDGVLYANKKEERQ